MVTYVYACLLVYVGERERDSVWTYMCVRDRNRDRGNSVDEDKGGTKKEKDI